MVGPGPLLTEPGSAVTPTAASSLRWSVFPRVASLHPGWGKGALRSKKSLGEVNEVKLWWTGVNKWGKGMEDRGENF